MSMTLRIEIFPNDLGPTVDFYTGVLDFDLVRDESAAEAAYVAFERGEVKLGAAARPDHRPDRDHRRPPTGVELVLEVDDVEAELDRVRSRGWPIEEELSCQTVGPARLPPPGPQRLLPAHHAALTPIYRTIRRFSAAVAAASCRPGHGVRSIRGGGQPPTPVARPVSEL